MKDIITYNRAICIYAIVAVVMHVVEVGRNEFVFVLIRTTIAGF
jgi:hypothetical protein